MRTTLVTLFVIALLTADSSGGASDSKNVTKTATVAFDLRKEVVGFVEDLTTNDPQIKALYKQLLAPTEEEAGGRFSLGKFEAIEWLVPDFHVNFENKGGTRDGEFVYIVRQQLRAGFHRGYSVNDNVLARIHVKLHEDHRPDSANKDGFLLEKTTLTLRFDGTVDMKPK